VSELASSERLISLLVRVITNEVLMMGTTIVLFEDNIALFHFVDGSTFMLEKT